ncbi:MAG: uridine phosphorylase [Psittacicella sp.]
MSLQFHLKINKEMIKGASIALIPGDPARAKEIASSLDGMEFLAANREFSSYLGFRNGTPIVVCSTGIGGPSTSIVVEELAEIGIKTFLRLGTTGAISKNVAIGDVIITTASVRLDGASLHFAPLAYPAVANFECLSALSKSANQVLNSKNIHMGITASSDTFYPGQERYDTFSGYVRKDYQGLLKEFKKLNVLNYEMESATLYTACSTLGLKAAMIAGVLINRNAMGETPDEAVVSKVEESIIAIGIKALDYLI